MQEPKTLTFGEFLAWEARQETLHEYVEGAIVALAAPTRRHARLVQRIFRAVDAGIAPPCEAFITTVLVETRANRRGRHPDLIVTCDERDRDGDEDERAFRHPKLIVEVLSETTAAADRSDKLEEYLAMRSVAEYVLVDSRRRWAQTYRASNRRWVASVPASSGRLHIVSLGIALDLDAIYDGLVPAVIEPHVKERKSRRLPLRR